MRQHHAVSLYYLFAALTALCSGVSAFSVFPERVLKSTTSTAKTATLLYQSSSDDSANDDDNSLDSLRSMLEASWNAEVMGDVPKDPETAARAAATALTNALQSQQSRKQAYFVDLLFPPYDRSQGAHLYDEVSAVEFGIALANQLAAPSLILVPDQATRASVQRVLDARTSSTTTISEEEEEDEYEYDDDDEDGEINEMEVYDDFADFGPIGSIEEQDTSVTTSSPSTGGNDNDTTSTQSTSQNNDTENTPSSDTESPPSARLATSEDIDSFRQKLMSDWDTIPTTTSTEDDDGKNVSKPKASASKPPKRQTKIKKTSSTNNNTSDDKKNYRLASLFGSATISTGSDMGGDVVQAIQDNVQPLSTEQFLIVLATENSPTHLLAIRRILQQYTQPAFDDTDPQPKTVVLVNCPLEDPLPRELIGAPTVYSLLPLIARAAAPDRTPFQQQESSSSTSAEQQPKPPKVAVLRRFPQDWQVFVDDGSTGSFELAASAPVGPPAMRRPPMQWISAAVAKFLQSRAQ